LEKVRVDMESVNRSRLLRIRFSADLTMYWFPVCHFRFKEFKPLVIWIRNQNIAISTIVGTSSHIKVFHLLDKDLIVFLMIAIFYFIVLLVLGSLISSRVRNISLVYFISSTEWSAEHIFMLYQYMIMHMLLWKYIFILKIFQGLTCHNICQS
jgi:hypothetical protein